MAYGKSNGAPVLPAFGPGCKSLLARHLTADIHGQLCLAETPSGYTFDQLIQSGVQHEDSSVGVYAGDAESYQVFSPLLDPIIEEYHRLSRGERHPGRLGSRGRAPAGGSVPEGPELLSVRVRVGRNLSGYPFPPFISRRARAEVEAVLTGAFSGLQGGAAGNYRALPSIPPAERDELVERHLLFREGDRHLEAAGVNRHWPHGRGLFLAGDGVLSAWVNEEDHLRIIALRPGGDVARTFEDLRCFAADLEERISFAYDERLGYLTSCPSNLGTAMRASVLIRLPRLARRLDELRALADQHDLQVRGLHGESSKVGGDVFDLSNRRRLGVTEEACIEALVHGLEAISMEERG